MTLLDTGAEPPQDFGELERWFEDAVAGRLEAEVDLVHADDNPTATDEASVSPVVRRVPYRYTVSPPTPPPPKPQRHVPMHSDAQKEQWLDEAPQGRARAYLHSPRRFLREWVATVERMPPLYFVAATLSARGFKGDGLEKCIRAPWVRAELRKLGVEVAE